jgi:hypothetical protein
MILSHKHKFIFLKTNKTAGTSIEIALSKFCGPDDVITPITPEDELLRNKLGYRGPQYYVNPPRGDTHLDKAYRDNRSVKEMSFYNHCSASEVKSYFGQTLWDDYFKFCVERNPWDRVVSLYYWDFQSEPRPPISAFVRSDALLRLKLRGYQSYTIDGQIAVDKICRFERLTEDLEVVRQLLGIPEELVLPHAKSRFRKPGVDYRSVFGAEEKTIIANLFSEEIKLLGYVF